MKNVVINGKSIERRAETPVKLNNGSLVVHYNKLGDVLGAYVVTSYRDQNKTLRNTEHTASFCSLVDLDNGYLKFEERCSRTTTMARVLSHLNPSDYAGAEAIKDGQYVEVYAVGTYKIDLSFDRNDNIVK